MGELPVVRYGLLCVVHTVSFHVLQGNEKETIDLSVVSIKPSLGKQMPKDNSRLLFQSTKYFYAERIQNSLLAVFLSRFYQLR